MPTSNRKPRLAQSPPSASPPTTLATLPLAGDILDGGQPASALASSKLTVACYGRNGVGKTTFACQGEGPICLISIEPSPTGGARSVAGRNDITVYQVASGFLQGRDGTSETVRGSEKVLAIAGALRQRFNAGQCPFRKVVIDGITSWNDVILGEVLGVDYANMPAVLAWGAVSMDQYRERGERLMRYLKPFLELPCDLWILAQEKDHNPPKEIVVTRTGKEATRVIQSKLMHDAHPMLQEGSFFSLAVGDAQAKFVQDACDFVLQLYEDAEIKEEKLPDLVAPNGQVIPGRTQQVVTGRRVKRLRCSYHPNYAARCRCADYRNVPEYIEAPSPEERYAAFLDVVAGKRTKWGHYV
jgi:hypothetical protein